MRRWILPILAFPVMVMLVTPAAIVYYTRNTSWASAGATPATPWFWLGLAFALLGGVLSGWSMALFARVGEGTAVSWDPPRRFVIRGPYRHVRNPMISGVQAMLIAEALLLRSWPLAIWCLLFGIGNAVYIPLKEEKVLAKRYGQDYAEYKQHVPRWLPRPTPWLPPEDVQPPPKA
ncbi:MAG: isoprenylcysteine carboxylmethyltransferase family protein [Victivallales bacterium]|nr:isoprenylcysteine carboxylmethyltransferase family protein [Victivallales bacterium]